MGFLSFKEEVVKVIETGAALGFYFGGRESQMVGVIASREKEDIARFQEGIGAFIYCRFDDFDIPFRYFLFVTPLLLAKDSMADSSPASGNIISGLRLG
ncbi:hypothetical protein LWI29_016280 [Acer saccharum]|uniref:Uncharacterized protein n=1 Tax=Acer saccharum TaxID=4024 RepID=A0AA39SDU9_ACESA|nr:hypothetical protein LWI29_016280 [Acer saccharum]